MSSAASKDIPVANSLNFGNIQFIIDPSLKSTALSNVELPRTNSATELHNGEAENEPEAQRVLSFAEEKNILEYEGQGLFRKEDILECDFCKKQFTIANNGKWNLKIHLRRCHTNNKPFKCTVCGEKFAISYDLKAHAIKHESQDKLPFSCQYCTMKFRRKDTLKGHLAREHEPERNCFECTVCGQKFFQSSKLKYHLKKSHIAKLVAETVDDSEKDVPCGSCRRKFSSLNALANHVKFCKGKVRQECDICGKKFKTLRFIEIHRRKHTGETPYECPDCDKKFYEPSTFRRHRLAVHSTERPHKCKYCGRGFLEPRDLRNHERLHTGDRPHICEICLKGYTSPELLKNHKKTHLSDSDRTHICFVANCNKRFHSEYHLKKHAVCHLPLLIRQQSSAQHCPICDKVYRSYTGLRWHLKAHHGELGGAVTDFQPTCEQCGKVYHSISGLRWHVKQHHGDGNDIICQTCGKVYQSYTGLKSHVRNSHSEQPTLHFCEACGKIFQTDDGLIRHIRRVHGIHEVTFYQCGICQAVFRSQESYTQHAASHTVGSSGTLAETDTSNSATTVCTDVNSIQAPTPAASLDASSAPTEATIFHCQTCGTLFQSFDVFTRHHCAALSAAEALDQVDLLDPGDVVAAAEFEVSQSDPSLHSNAITSTLVDSNNIGLDLT